MVEGDPVEELPLERIQAPDLDLLYSGKAEEVNGRFSGDSPLELDCG